MDRTIATRALAAAFAVGAVAQALLVRAELGINVPLLVASTMAAAAFLAKGGRKIDRLDLWLPVAALAISAMVAIRSDPMLLFLDVVAVVALLGASMAAFAGATVTRRSALAIIGTGMVVLAWVGAGILRVSFAARRPEPGPGRLSRMPGWAGPVARGLLLALPILIVFVALFSSADAIFATIAADLFGWEIDFGELPIRVAVALFVAWIVAGLLGVAAGGAELDWPPRPLPMQSLGAAAVEPLPLAPRLGATEALTILVAVDLLFAAFVSLQVAYLFGGLDTLAAGGITYANYARRGFFELVTVTCIAGGLVVGLHAVVAERTRAFVAAAVGLAVLTFVILVSAALRLSLYQDAYGWTELRFYIDATIAWLGLGIVAAIVLLVRDRMRWLIHSMTVAAVAVLVVVNVVGAQRHVADANVARLLDPSLVPPDGRHGLDLFYAVTLGDDAVPALIAALPALPAEDRAWLMLHLEARWQELNRPEATALPAWNLARERARASLATLFGSERWAVDGRRSSGRYTRGVNLPFDPPLEPMLAKAADKLPTDDGWLFEPKWDGFRAIVFRDGDEVYTQSRDLKPLDRYFPELAEPLRAALPNRCIVDGEVVISKNGELDFEALLLRIHPAASRVKMLAGESPASFVAWDLLALDGDDLRALPQGERRTRLEGVLGSAPAPVHLTPATTDRALADDWFHRFEGAGLDGVIAKRLSDQYQPGKRAMLKVKHQRTADCVVAGFRWHKNGPGTHVGSLLLGLYDDEGTLHHVGVTSSFTWDKRAALVPELEPLRKDALEGHPWGEWADWAAAAEAAGQRLPGATSRWNRGKDLSWEPLRTERVVEVAYDHLQGDRFRHGTTFKRWRPDKPPAECRYDQLEETPAYEIAKIFGA